MANVTRWNRPSIFSLQRDIDDLLDEFTSPRALRREVDRLFGEDLPMRSLWQEMDRLFEEFVSPTPLRRRVHALFEPFGAAGHPRNGAGMSKNGAMFVPDLELVELEKEYLLNVDIPGMRQEDVHVSVDDDNVLKIRGERREEQTQAMRGYEYTERRYGTFSRSVELPRGVDASSVDAEYHDGVLMIHIPKSERAMGRQIPVVTREGGRDMRGVGSENARNADRRERAHQNAR